MLFLLIDAAAYSSAVFGRGYGSIIMHHVTCTSSESTLAQCGKTLGSSGCNHREDAGIRCAGTHAMHACILMSSINRKNNNQLCNWYL